MPWPAGAPSAHSQLGKVGHSQQSVYKTRHSRPGPEFWEFSSSLTEPCGLQDSEGDSAVLQLSFGVWEGWRSQCRCGSSSLWSFLEMWASSSSPHQLEIFPRKKTQESWEVKGEFSLIHVELVPRVDYMGKSWNLSAMQEPTMVGLMVIVGFCICLVLWDLPNISGFPWLGVTLQQLCLIQMCTAGKPRCFQIREKAQWGVR